LAVALLGLTALRAIDQPDVALLSLLQGDARLGYACADRWIRSAGGRPESLLMRAEAALRLGLDSSCLEDLRAGVGIDPLDARVNSRLLILGSDEERAAAAQVLIWLSRRDAKRGLADVALHGGAGMGQVKISGRSATGWAIWRKESQAYLKFIGASEIAHRLKAQDDLTLSALGARATRFLVVAPNGDLRSVRLEIDGQVVDGAHIRGPGGFEEGRDGGAVLEADHAEVTIVVPVFADFDATRDCLNSVLAELDNHGAARLIVIDDASPDPRLANHVAKLRSRTRCGVLQNPVNLGFVGSVNRALRVVKRGDALLLNSDTLLPLGGLRRFRDAAAVDDAIGVINPLSNHGEFVSFPRAFRFNPFDERRWRAIDAAASVVNRGMVVDIPSGTGFCMYMTRACLDRVGEFSDQFGDGYLEDADFGLRARDAGFRNVCAADIYVPHLGSRSFGSTKGALVARNRLTLGRRFPDYERECDAFLAADPLAEARARLRKEEVNPLAARRLLVAHARMTPVLLSRNEQLKREGTEAILVTYARVGQSLRLGARFAAEDAPQSAFVPIDEAGEAAISFLQRWRSDRVELFVDGEDVDFVGRAICRRFESVDLVVAGPAPFAAIFDFLEGVTFQQREARRTAVSPRHRQCWPMDGMSRAYLGRVIHPHSSLSLSAAPAKRPSAAGSLRPDEPRFAVILPYETAASLSLLLKLSSSARRHGLRAVVWGATVADHRILADGHFVTGVIAASDCERSAGAYGVDAYVLLYRDGGFWALEQAQEARPAPAAYFDWSQAGLRKRPDDLPIELSACDDEAVVVIVDWLLNGVRSKLRAEVIEA
jgi:GT2 family glycosyltransferase